MQKVPLFFNTTGPCEPKRHYMLPPKDRLVGANLERYISHHLYWVLHAPRQTGKTTFLKSWMKEINEKGEAIACYVSVERAQSITDAKDSIPIICEAIQDHAKIFLNDINYIPQLSDTSTSYGSALHRILADWAERCAPKPLVVLFDEVDVLEDQTMISFLRQLREGFASREIGKFPISIALVGMRDLRDYLVESKDGKSINPGSPFNIKQDSVNISNFSKDNIKSLLQLHTDETGQIFELGTADTIFNLSQGQPWLTNAIAQKCVWQLCPNNEQVTVDNIYTAKEMLINERAVHLDSLSERLKDPKIRRVIETIITGDSDPEMTQSRDFLLALDLGLVKVENGNLIIANPIYKEIIARVLTFGMQTAIPSPEFRWEKDDGTLDMNALMVEFQKFWRRHSAVWETKSNYTEAFPHLLLMAFLQRVVNGGGRVEREYAAGRGRVDLAIEYNNQWNIIEIKLIHPYDGRKITVKEGLVQVTRYRDTISPNAPTYLVVFDRTEAGRKKSWEERLTIDNVKMVDGRVVVVVGG